MFFDTEFLKNEEIQLILEKTVETDPVKNWLPAYHFFICDKIGVKMGVCDLRVGYNERVYYGGNIGYRVERPYRGHHYAGKAGRDGVRYYHLQPGQLGFPEDMRVRGREADGDCGAARGQRYAPGGRGDREVHLPR